MTFNTSRIVLFCVFFVSALICLIYLQIWRDTGQIEVDVITDLRMRVVTLYVIFLTIIITGFFKKGGMREGKVPRNAFWVALLISIAWNFAFYYTLRRFIQKDYITVREFNENVNILSTIMAPIITAALTYFFAVKESEKTKKEPEKPAVSKPT